MGFFSKKKKLPEPGAPGFAELEVSDEDILNSIPVSNIEEGNVKLPDQLPELPMKKKNVPDLPEDAETEEEINLKKLPEIPGIHVKEIGENKNKEEQDKGYGIITPMKKELPKRITMDLKEAEEHPEKILSKRTKPEQRKEDNEFSDSNNSDRSVFIKIEDFNSITFAIQEIKNKVMIIDRDITEIKIIKSKQDSEILAWERELVEIKDRLSSIDGILKRKTHG
ncbi:hypothetical protein J4465_01470 [Candidatus Pacearchaeota archaeon]|nr:hypothetical protein [Candidatus Pacearchaeota archaeon]